MKTTQQDKETGGSVTPRKGLVLEGGAMRGLFTAGVLDAMCSVGIRFDGIIGVSAGACFGCNYKSHQPGRVIRYNKILARDPEVMQRVYGMGVEAGESRLQQLASFLGQRAFSA